jgi:hypothetical protein
VKAESVCGVRVPEAYHGIVQHSPPGLGRSTSSASDGTGRSAGHGHLSRGAAWVGNTELEIKMVPERRTQHCGYTAPGASPANCLRCWLEGRARTGRISRRFAHNAKGSRLADVRRGIGNAAIDRLAFPSGSGPRTPIEENDPPGLRLPRELLPVLTGHRR